MRFRKDRAPKEPKTLVGRWLVASLTHDLHDPRADAMREELNRTGWLHVESVLSECLRLAISAVYTPNIPDAVRTIREHYQQHGDGVAFTQEEGELLLRAAHGEDVSTASIPGEAAFSACALFSHGIIRDLDYTKEQIYELLVKAEELAAAGAHEPLIFFGQTDSGTRV